MPYLFRTLLSPNFILTSRQGLAWSLFESAVKHHCNQVMSKRCRNASCYKWRSSHNWVQLICLVILQTYRRLSFSRVIMRWNRRSKKQLDIIQYVFSTTLPGVSYGDLLFSIAEKLGCIKAMPDWVPKSVVYCYLAVESRKSRKSWKFCLSQLVC